MTLLEFARGPALQWALIIFVAGIFWRVVGAAFLIRSRDLSRPRNKSPAWGGLRTMFSRSWAHHEFHTVALYPTVVGYIWHIGFIVVLFFYVPHILFFEGLLGVSWPGLRSDFIMWVGGVSMLVLLLLLIRRITHPVLRRISDADDYISWFATFAPMVTGLLAYGHLGPRYETMLAIHVLSVDFFFIWFPFGKLMHAVLVFPTRAQNGAFYERRGVKA